MVTGSTSIVIQSGDTEKENVMRLGLFQGYSGPKFSIDMDAVLEAEGSVLIRFGRRRPMVPMR